MLQRFLRLEEVELVTGLAKSSIYEAMAKGRFPKPVRITPRRVGWLESEIAAWQEKAIATARQEAA